MKKKNKEAHTDPTGKKKTVTPSSEMESVGTGNIEESAHNLDKNIELLHSNIDSVHNNLKELEKKMEKK
jgi:hypothetical protein